MKTHSETRIFGKQEVTMYGYACGYIQEYKDDVCDFYVRLQKDGQIFNIYFHIGGEIIINLMFSVNHLQLARFVYKNVIKRFRSEKIIIVDKFAEYIKDYPIPTCYTL